MMRYTPTSPEAALLPFQLPNANAPDASTAVMRPHLTTSDHAHDIVVCSVRSIRNLALYVQCFVFWISRHLRAFFYVRLTLLREVRSPRA